MLDITLELNKLTQIEPKLLPMMAASVIIVTPLFNNEIFSTGKVDSF